VIAAPTIVLAADVGGTHTKLALARFHGGALCIIGRHALAVGAVCFHPRRGRAAGKAQAVHLADHRVAGDAADATCDLAGTQSLTPELFQQLYSFIGPGHACRSLQNHARVLPARGAHAIEKTSSARAKTCMQRETRAHKRTLDGTRRLQTL